MSDTPEIRALWNIVESSLSDLPERHNEIRGLASIIGNGETLHTIAEAPDPDDFPDQASYVQAYDQWWTDTNCWKLERIATKP
jgi:hypothetical protein